MTYTDQHYTDASGKLYFLSAADHARAAAPDWKHGTLPNPSWKLVTDAEAEAIRNPPPTLEQAQTRAAVLIASAWNRALDEPVSITTQSGAVAVFGPDAIQWLPHIGSDHDWANPDGSITPITPADAAAGVQALLDHRQAVARTRTDLLTRVSSAATVAEAVAITWPNIKGE